MIDSNILKTLTIIMGVITFTSCTDLSNRTLPENDPTGLLTEADNGSSSTNGDWNNEEHYSEYSFTAGDEIFLAQTVFIGDNLCYGLLNNGIITSERIIANKEATAINAQESHFNYEGGNIDALSALINTNPTYIVMTFGSNYSDIENTDVYCEKYMDFISLVKNYCAAAKIIILSSPPVNQNSFSGDNETIRNYNTALEQAVSDLDNADVKFLNICKEIENPNGTLKYNYNSENDLLLTKRGYYAVLWQICNNYDR